MENSALKGGDRQALVRSPNRILILSVAALLLSLAVIGAIAPQVEVPQLDRAGSVPEMIAYRGFGAALGIVTMVLILSCTSSALDIWRALAVTFGAYVVSIASYPVVMSLSGVIPWSSVANELTYAALGLPIVAAAPLYAVGRESVLRSRFDELTQARKAVELAEDQVRSLVFDQLHGTVQARLTLVRLRLNDLIHNCDDGAVTDTLKGIGDEVNSVYEDVIRPLAYSLHPSAVDVGLVRAVNSLAEMLAEGSDRQVEVRASALLTALDTATKSGIERSTRTTVYRLVEEGLSNALKHGDPGPIVVDLSVERSGNESWLWIRVVNEYVGGSIPSPGRGFAAMQQRVAAAEGSLKVDLQHQQFRVEAGVPIRCLSDRESPSARTKSLHTGAQASGETQG